MLQTAELMELLEDFYISTGMRIALFDERFCELCSFPAGKDTLCACLRASPAFDRKCRESDMRAFLNVQKTRSISIYRCHAGLMEATVSISENERIIGYMMLGQITDRKNREEVAARMRALCGQYGIPASEELEEKVRKIRYQSEKQTRAAAKILEACAAYVILKDIVRASERSLVDRIERFIDDHLNEDLTAAWICAKFHIGRTHLYNLLRPYAGGGISAFIKRKRLARAKELLKTTALPVSAIAEAVGFADYNYFLRCFKKEYGVSSGYYRTLPAPKKENAPAP